MSKEIVLRVNKGSALTYDEMDRNQSQFYFSSSLSGNGSILRLHYTGSTSLNATGADYSPGFDTIQLPITDTTIPEAVAAGDTNEIQFNTNDAFDADPLFTFIKSKNYLGIGVATPQARLHIEGDETYPPNIYLNGIADANGADISRAASVSFAEGGTTIGSVGRTLQTNKHIYLENHFYDAATRDSYGKVNIAIAGSTGNEQNTIASFDLSGNFPSLGIGTGDVNLGNGRNISVVGSQGIGFSTSTNFDLASFISPIPTSLNTQTDSNGVRTLIPNLSTIATDGLLISSPKDDEGGNVVLNINTDSLEHETFNIISSQNRDFSNSKIIGSFKASGKVGINTGVATDVGLTVAGVISGSGNFSTEGTATVGTIADGSSASTSTLVATTAGLVQKIAAAPVPKGGIIMWSGTSVPAGWNLCDGSGDVNGVTVPDLRDRFVVSSGTTYTVNDTGGSNTHNHGGNTGNTTLTLSQIPSHTHDYDDAYYAERVSGAGGVGGNSVRGDGDGGGTDTDNSFAFRTRNNDGQFFSSPPTGANQPRSEESGGGGSHNHSIDSANNIPLYYALAFIIYVGA